MQAESIAATLAPAPAEPGQVQHLKFADMRLRVGDRLLLSPPVKVSSERFPVRLVGYVEGVSVLVTHPYERFLRLPLHEGDEVVMRAFVAQSAFGFSTWVEKIYAAPFDHLHLSFPESVQGMAVRKAPRVKMRIIASVNNLSQGAGENMPGIIANISASGVLLDSPHPLAEKNDRMRLAFKVELHGMEAFLTVEGVARNVWMGEAAEGQKATFHHGIEFVDLDPSDQMILQSLVYQHMIDSPQNLI